MTVDFASMHNRTTIEKHLRRQPDLHLYELGDLDDFFWPHTVWFALPGDAGLDDPAALCLLYLGAVPPTLLALGDAAPRTRLVASLDAARPARFYAHLSPGVEAAFTGRWHLQSHGDHLKMSLRQHAALAEVDDRGAERLGPAQREEVLALYRDSYPGIWFDPRMLETRDYFGVRDAGRLVSIAGVHVFSPTQRVAALGNITTAPTHRGRGLAAVVTATVCRSLLERVDHLGLNVAADNLPAIACYRKLGFEPVAPYREFTVATLQSEDVRNP